MTVGNIERSDEFLQKMVAGLLLRPQASDVLPSGSAPHIYYKSSDKLIHFVDDTGVDVALTAVSFATVLAALAAASAPVGFNGQPLTGVGGVALAANGNISCAAGTTAFDLSAGTGPFKTPSGPNTLSGDVTVAAGKNFSLAAGAGSLDASAATGAIKLGASSATLAFFGVAAVARASAYTMTYNTAAKTVAALTVDDLTDNSGGAAGTTIAAITTGGAAADQVPTRNAIASLVAEVAKIKADILSIKKNTVAVINDMQAYGLLQ